MIEKILFNVLAFAIFISIFWKLIKRNDTTYVYILILEFLGIGARFVSILNNIKLNFISILINSLLAFSMLSPPPNKYNNSYNNNAS